MLYQLTLAPAGEEEAAPPRHAQAGLESLDSLVGGEGQRLSAHAIAAAALYGVVGWLGVETIVDVGDQFINIYTHTEGTYTRTPPRCRRAAGCGV